MEVNEKSILSQILLQLLPQLTVLAVDLIKSENGRGGLDIKQVADKTGHTTEQVDSVLDNIEGRIAPMKE